MNERRLDDLMGRFDRARILVVGDFFLDKYLVLDDALTETSIETGLEAYQVVGKRLSPGAAGTVTSNLRALDAGSVYALGMIGRDGEGYDLRAGLHATGVLTDLLVETDARFTPTYTKPMLRHAGSERELNRLDIKNRQPLPAEVERRILDTLREMAPQVDAVIGADQVQERNCGVVTDAVRKELAVLADRHPDAVFIVDSRVRVGEYRGLWVKPNRSEACRALGIPEPSGQSPAETVAVGRALAQRNGRPVFVTLAEEGILCVTSDGAWHVPTLRQTGPLDICGAGDSVMAGATLALCAGARPEEAALVGNLVASITVQQIGVTGTASRTGVLQRYHEAGEQFAPRAV